MFNWFQAPVSSQKYDIPEVSIPSRALKERNGPPKATRSIKKTSIKRGKACKRTEDVILEEVEFPIPNFSNLSSTTMEQSGLSPLSSQLDHLPFPITPIAKNHPVLSPTRSRTPGSGILSPRTKGSVGVISPFRSLTYRDLIANKNACTSPGNTSFHILDEECEYDSDEYLEEDKRFPRWGRKGIHEIQLQKSNKVMYDTCFTPRNVPTISSDQLYKGKTSKQFDKPLKNGALEYASLKSFQLGRPVGQGKFGTIYLARVKKKKEIFVAIKVMFKRCLTKNHVNQLLREIKHLDKLRSANIISLYDFFHDENRIFLVMEYACGGDLYHSLTKKKRFSEKEAASIFLQGVRAIQTCHLNGIVHRDIKPENFVWGSGDVLKLIDFGWSAPCSVGQRRNTLCGTFDYLPPEMVLSKPYGQMADIWCLGVLLYELLTGSPPFADDDMNATKLNIKYVSYTIPEYISKEGQYFIKQILKADPLSRPTLQQLVEANWVVKNTPSSSNVK